MLPDWLEALHVRGDGETAGEHCARVVRALDGVSLDEHRDHLAQLFYANEPDEARAALVASWETNCASSARAILALAGVEPTNAAIMSPLRVGAAMALLRDGCRAGLVPGAPWSSAQPGWLAVYWSGVGNDAHVEWILSTPDAIGVADHGGGGRARNAITCEHGSILASRGRPLHELYDPALIATNPATGDDPY